MPAIRKSNIELLRIIAILMIISAHFVGHGIMEVTSSSPYIAWAKGSIINRIFSSFFVGGGDIGIGIFFIITGYFMVNYNKIRSLYTLILEIIFYSIISSIIVVISYCWGNSINKNLVLTQLIVPISGSVWWFISAYILLILSLPSINYYLEKLNNKQMLIVLIFLWIIWYSLGKVLYVQYYSFIRALWFYLIGAYFKRTDFQNNRMTIFLCLIITWILYAYCTFMVGNIIGSEHDSVFLANIFKFARTCIFAPISSMAFFLLFNQIDIREIKSINSIATATLGIYLLHDSPGGRLLFWNVLFNVKEKIYIKEAFPFYMIIIIITIFIIGILVDSFRKYWAEPIAIKLTKIILDKIV